MDTEDKKALSQKEQRIITLLLNEQFGLRSNIPCAEVLEEEELIYDSLAKGDQVVSKMDKTIGSMASLFSGAHTTIDGLNQKLEDATNNKVDNTIDQLKKEKNMFQNTLNLITEVDVTLKLLSGIAPRLDKIDSFSTCTDVLNDCIRISKFMTDRQSYKLYSTHESEIRNNLQNAFDRSVLYFKEVFEEISRYEELSKILLKESYVDQTKLKLLKKAMPLIFEAGTLLKANAKDVFSAIYENRNAYLISVVQAIELPQLIEKTEIVEYTVGYTNGKNQFITTMKYILSLFQNERIFQQDILQNDFDQFFSASTLDSFKLFKDLYVTFANKLKLLDTPFCVFPILDVLEVYQDTKQDFINALRVNEDPKKQNKGFITLEKGINVLTSTFTFGAEKKEEEEDDLFVENTTEDKRDSQTKQVDSLFDTIFYDVKEQFLKFRDEVLVDSTLNKIFSWTESNIPIDGTVSQLAADTMHYLSKLEKFLPHLIEYMVRIYKEAQVNTAQEPTSGASETVVGMYVHTCIDNLCKMVVARGEKEKTRLGMLFIMNNYAFIMNVCKLDGFEKLLGKSTQDTVEKALSGTKEHYLYAYKNTLKMITDNLLSRPGKSKDIKKAFETFNKDFQALHTVSSTYSVYNDELKEDLRQVLVECIQTPYAEFYANYVNNKFTQNPSKYFLYTEKSVADCINSMFTAHGEIEKDSLDITEHIPDFLKSLPHFMPKITTLSSLATPLQNMPQRLKNISNKPVTFLKAAPNMFKSPLKTSKKLIKSINPF
ncbi:hypothetical protein EIN_409520 [Entamoeba invadens IP1]|uniref:Exocyst subunit Exo70 family protein n=1 Tax=Entamoeba invadens IP1 TaxID=370355 RepID=A0A0A1U2A4_ENTIV|nr:hypothetical protein EIN_409520 [Entamoeba invadens IP1]ELP85643.1 hypothetical protein EIN_409520 [Entamoeba invadens IP1]|eukprot:XP_004184989.1 hypothetical protein EIN_409520 [Entamoeba invadens IP1]